MTGAPGDDTPRTFELTPGGRPGEASSRTAIGVLAGTQLGFLLVVVLLAVTLPPARIFLAAWFVWVAFVLVRAVRQARRRSRGLVCAPTLWLTADLVGYTDTRGVTISCPRLSVQSAVLAYVTLGSRTRDLLLLRDIQDNALLEAPLLPWRPEDIDRFTDELGVGAAHRVFVDSLDSLQRLAHGASLDDPVAARAFRGYQRVAMAYLMYVMSLSVAAGIAAVCGVVLWTITGRQDVGGIAGVAVFGLIGMPLILFTHRVRRVLRAG